MKKITWAIVTIFLLLPGPSTAQFYRYIDQNGTLRFTDDINKVPVEQRANIREYSDSMKGSGPSPREGVTEAAKPPAEKAEPNNGLSTGADVTVSNEELRARIQRMIEQLEAEYIALMKLKEALAEERASMKSREEMAGYNKAVDAFNQQAENYEKMSRQLHKLIDEYNVLVPEEKQN